MKKSITLIFFFSLCIIKHIAGQATCDTAPYRHVYYNKGYAQTQMRGFSFASNNDIFLSGYVNHDPKNSNADAWLMRTTYHGTPLWSKAIGTYADENVISMLSIRNQGYIFYGDTKYAANYPQGWLAKIDSSGNVVWSLKLKSGYGSINRVAKLDNGDYIAVGTLYIKFSGDRYGNISKIEHSTNFIVRLNDSGNIIWQRSFYNDEKESLIRVQQMPDGNLVAVGIVLNTSIAYILKIDQHSGNILWMNQFEKTTNYGYSNITQLNNGGLSFKMGSRMYFFNADGTFKPGSYEINITSNGIAAGGQIQDVGADGPNKIYNANIKPSPILFCEENNSNVLWAHSYNFNSSDVLTLGGSRVFRNNIYTSGSYTTHQVSDSTSKEQMAYLLKASMKGEASCIADADIRFTTSLLPPFTNVSHSWVDEGSVEAEFIPLYSTNIEPVRLLNCSQQDCCSDVAITINDQVCDHSIYVLPDGKTAKGPGFYTSRFTTNTGCDSIVYTILSTGNRASVLLPPDTCFTNNQPVTFTLNADSTVKYIWQDGTTTSQYTASFPGKYSVTAISACNVVADTVLIHDNCAPAMFIPSAFTPNNDGLNDVFRIPVIIGQHLQNMNIYNRFGQLIFHSNDPYKGWDGNVHSIPQSSGTYIYTIKYFDLSGKQHYLKGTVVIIR